MIRGIFAPALKRGGVTFFLVLLLFADSVWQPSDAFGGSTLQEITAVLRDADTQWMVFLCLAIYFATFVILRRRAEDFLTQRRNGAKTGAHGVTRPTFWLAGALFMSSVLYAIDYSPSTQALTLLAGAVIGQGMAVLLKSGRRKAESEKLEGGGQKSVGGNGFVAFVLVIFILLLTLASVWQVASGYSFEYRSHARWAGPWDNPNVFGLLMGTGVALAVGGAVSILGRSRGNEAYSSKSEIGNRKSEIIEPPHVVSYKSRMVSCLLACGCLVAAGFMGRGLLNSYSRGAWVATAGGLGYLLYQVVRQKRKAESEKAETQWGKAEGGNREIGNALSPALSHPMGEGVPRSTLNLQLSTILRHNWLPISVILISVLVLSFWHFRQTEWHPARRALSAVNPVDFSWRNRVAAWEGALQIMAERPWFGAGWNQPEPLYEHYYLSPKLTESAAIQMNDYLMLGATLGFPGLFCFAVYIGLSLFGGARPPRVQFSAPSRKTSDVWQSSDATTTLNQPEVGCGPHPTTPVAGVLPIPYLPSPSFLAATCRAGAIVLLVGFWFDGGLFILPTAATFWILLELGSVWNHEIQE